MATFKVEFTEKLWTSMDGKKTIDRLTVIIGGKEAYVFDKNTIGAYAARGNDALNTIKLHIMGTTRALNLSEENTNSAAQQILKKMQSYKL